MRTVVRVFRDRDQTEKAVDRLAEWVDSDKIGVLWRDVRVEVPDTIERVHYEDHFEGRVFERRYEGFRSFDGLRTAWAVRVRCWLSDAPEDV